VDWVPVGLAEKRQAKLISHAKLQKMANDDPGSVALTMDNMMNVYYPQRPMALERWCLFRIYTDYDRISESEVVG
jgi:hypothetical protein